MEEILQLLMNEAPSGVVQTAILILVVKRLTEIDNKLSTIKRDVEENTKHRHESIRALR